MECLPTKTIDSRAGGCVLRAEKLMDGARLETDSFGDVASLPATPNRQRSAL